MSIAEPRPVHSPALSTAEEIIDDARNGRMFILVDNEDRENEGDLIIPAQMATPDTINFMAKHARGLICLAMTDQRIHQLGLPLMSAHNGTRHQTAFTVSIEAKEGVTTGISAADRARTVQVAIDPSRGRDDIVTPGHVFPLAAREGGVLVRAGHTEAAVDVARMAGLVPAGVICEIMNDDGTMARLPELIAFAQRHGLKIGTIADLISYRRVKDKLIECIGTHDFQSRYGGEWTVRVYRNATEGTENIALVKGSIEPGQPTLVRMHTMAIFEDLFGRTGARSLQLQSAMREIGAHGSGVVVLLRPTAQMLFSEVIASASMQKEPVKDVVLREYGIGAQILVDLGVKNMILLTNSRRHLMVGLEGYGLNVVAERPIPAFSEV
jgi:3,4-dihydroxy 2-butanone 4-phosphate synthase/GTP cyclohydrolase II